VKMTTRSALLLALLLAVSSVAAAADAKDIESTPQAMVYRASLKAIADGDYAAYTRCITTEAVQEIEKQTRELGKTPRDGMELMKVMAPTNVKFTNLEVKGKKAVLSATGEHGEEVLYGLIDVAEEDGQWKVSSQTWSNTKG
jgi:hypothetical protein